MAKQVPLKASSLDIIKEEINKKTSFNIPGLVNQLNYDNYLLPLFEAIINAIQSIYISKTNKGLIEIYINRSAGQKSIIKNEDSYKVQYIKDIIISDNGEGFNNKNLKSFLDAYTTEKQQYGCKGVGRFTWLKAFREVKIESTFKDNKISLQRQFTYKLPNGIQNDYSEQIIDAKTNNRTLIKLIDLQDKFFFKSNQKIITIAKRIIEHCFYYLAQKNAPKIIISGYDNEDRDEKPQSICLNSMFSELYDEHIKNKTLTIKGNRFNLMNVKMFDNSEESSHKVYFCANNRTTEEYSIKSITHLIDLDGKLFDKVHNKNFYYVAYLSGKYLDGATDTTRSNFIIKSGTTGFNDPEYLTLTEIKNAISPYLKKFIVPYLENLNKEKVKKIQEFVKVKAPQYNYLLNERDDFFSDVPLTANDNELRKIIHSKHYDKKLDLFTQFEEKVNKLQTEGAIQYKDYKKELENLNQKIGEANQADLAEYVKYRKVILSLFAQYLKINTSSNKYFEEKIIHDLIYPMQSTSREVSYENHNLWLIDDRLSFSQFISSDKTIKAIGLNSKNSKEPDLLFFDSKNIYSDDNETSYHSSISIVEFKRPERKHYAKSKKKNKEENPINQVYGYIQDIKDGKIQDSNKRTIRTYEHTRYYGYVICDFNEQIETFAKQASLKLTPDGMGYFGYNPEYNCYIELISFDKLIADANKRNHIFFKKLGLEL